MGRPGQTNPLKGILEGRGERGGEEWLSLLWHASVAQHFTLVTSWGCAGQEEEEASG